MDQMHFGSPNCSVSRFELNHHCHFTLDPQSCGGTNSNGSFLNYDITMYGFNKKNLNGISRAEHLELSFSCSVKLGIKIVFF